MCIPKFYEFQDEKQVGVKTAFHARNVCSDYSGYKNHYSSPNCKCLIKHDMTSNVEQFEAFLITGYVGNYFTLFM